MNDTNCKDGQLLIQGPAGQLELQLNYAGECPGSRPLAVICHPHPLYGGSLTNKVVHMVGRAVNDLGLATVRFNFRGVGKSEGQFDDGRGETDDLQELTTIELGHADPWLLGRVTRSSP